MLLEKLLPEKPNQITALVTCKLTSETIKCHRRQKDKALERLRGFMKKMQGDFRPGRSSGEKLTGGWVGEVEVCKG